MTSISYVCTFAITALIYTMLVNLVKYNANVDLRKKMFSVLESVTLRENPGRSANKDTQRTVRGI